MMVPKSLSTGANLLTIETMFTLFAMSAPEITMDYYTLTHRNTGDVDVVYGTLDDACDSALDWSVEEHGDEIVISDDDGNFVRSITA